MRTRVEWCACGGVLHAPASATDDVIREVVAEHNATARHRLWLTRMEVAYRDDPAVAAVKVGGKRRKVCSCGRHRRTA